jgi:hypothetical protein
MSYGREEYPLYTTCGRVWGSPAEAKVFNPNIAKIDSKSQFLLSKQIYNVCRNKKCTFLENEMVRGSMVVRKIDLEEKQLCAPNPMIQEPYFSLPVVPALTVLEIVVQAPVATPPVATMSEDLEPVLQDPMESTIAHE